MTFKFYVNSAEPNRVNKTAYLTNELTVSGDVIDTVSFSSFKLQCAGSVFVGSSEKKPKYNYCFSSDLNRYYYITWTCDANGHWIADLSEDYLMSHKSGIYGVNAYIDRAERNASINANLFDAERRIEVGADFTDSAFSVIAADDEFLNYDTTVTGNTSNCFLIAIATVYCENTSGTRMYSPFPLTYLYTTAEGVSSLMRAASSAYQDFSSYVVSVKWTPFDLRIGSSIADQVRKIHCSPTLVIDLTTVADAKVVYMYKGDRLKTTRWSHANPRYLNYSPGVNCEPITEFSVKMNPFGYIRISSTDLAKTQTIYLRAKTDVLTGDSELMLGVSESLYYQTLSIANVYVDMPFYSEPSVGLNVVRAIAGGITGGVSGGGAGIAGGLMSGLDKAFSTHNPTIRGSIGSGLVDRKPRLITITRAYTSVPSSIIGSPSYIRRTLTSGDGYTHVVDAHLDGITTATEDELRNIDGLLKGGVIL